MSFSEAISPFLELPEMPILAAVPPRGESSLFPVAMQCVRNRIDETRRIISLGEQTLQLLEEVAENQHDQDRVNRLIGRIDSLRARMNELDNCYGLVEQLAQRATVDRFQVDRQIVAGRLKGIEKQRRQLERDMANVKGIMEAAGLFEQMMRNVLVRMESRVNQLGVAA
jgi:hypothetical protein